MAVKTANGHVERGNANQRHFVRAAEKIDSAGVVISHSDGVVCMSVNDIDALKEILALATEWSGEPQFDMSLNGNGLYSDGDVSVDVHF